MDDLFQFVDCTGVDGFSLAKDIRSGVVEIKYGRVAIALGNAARLDHFSNVSTCVTAVINALIERYGCINVKIRVMGLLPRPLAQVEEVECIKSQNKALFKAVRALVRRRNYPVQFVAAHKWFLKRVKNPEDDSTEVAVDCIYYEEGSNHLSESGLVHFHLLLAQELQLRRIKYEWKGMPVVVKKQKKRKVMENSTVSITGKSEVRRNQSRPKHLKAGVG